MIDRRIGASRLHPLHRGVYAVGHRKLTREGRWMAAVLAAGPGAVLSHRTAGIHWGLLRWSSGPIEVTIARTRRQRPGFRIHSSLLPSDEVTFHEGIPITTVPRTLFDLAGVVNQGRLERAFNEVEAQQLFDALSISALVTRYPGRRGNKKLRAIEAEGMIGEGTTRSKLEDAFVAFVAETGLPAIELNADIEVDGEWFEPDGLWRERKLIVELDSRKFHGTREAFRRDRRRDRVLLTAGFHSIRVTWSMLTVPQERRELHRDLLRLLELESRPRV